MTVEYTVRPVVRFAVTRWEDGVSQGAAWNTGSSYCGAFDNVEQANRIADAMSRVDPNEAAQARLLGADKAAAVEAAARDICRAQLADAP